MVSSELFIESYKNSKRFSLQSSVREDIDSVINQLADEISNSRIDYDEYYNQLVLSGGNAQTYGQNFGKYYSQFFNPGTLNGVADTLGYECNDGTRNGTECTVVRTTLDIQTGQNPYSGKPAPAGDNPNSANAFGLGAAATSYTGPELYLISSDAKTKTIYARERIGGAQANTPENPAYWALAKVKMTGRDDALGDGIIDAYLCAEGFECGRNATCDTGVDDGLPSKAFDLNPSNEAFTSACDNTENGFSHDFIPISPNRIDVMNLSFQISPLEDPQYAFSEQPTQRQPQVTISITVRPNPARVQDAKAFTPFTITRTVATQTGPQIKAPVRN